MYSLFDIFSRIEEQSESFCLQDRIKYKKLIQVAELFASENNLIVGGQSANRLLLGTIDSPPPVGLDSFQYDFYSDDAMNHARALGDALYASDPEGLGKYTTVTTKIPKIKFIISVDSRELFSISYLPIHRGVKMFDVIIPSLRHAQFSPNILACVGAEIQLIELYSKLINPSEINEWPILMELELELRKKFKEEIKTKITEVTGGSTELAGFLSKDSREKLLRLFYEKFIIHSDRVMIGKSAINFMLGARELSRLQFVTSKKLENELAELIKLVSDLRYDFQYTINDVNLPIDSRLKKAILYVIEGNKREPIVDIYNSASYEAVPFLLFEGAKIGSVFTLMKFRLVDMWTIQFLIKLKAIIPAYARETLHEILISFLEAEKLYHELFVDRIFPVNYIGKIEQMELILRRDAFTKGIHYPPYYPQLK